MLFFSLLRQLANVPAIMGLTPAETAVFTYQTQRTLTWSKFFDQDARGIEKNGDPRAETVGLSHLPERTIRRGRELLLKKSLLLRFRHGGLTLIGPNVPMCLGAVVDYLRSTNSIHQTQAVQKLSELIDEVTARYTQFGLHLSVPEPTEVPIPPTPVPLPVVPDPVVEPLSEEIASMPLNEVSMPLNEVVTQVESSGKAARERRLEAQRLGFGSSTSTVRSAITFIRATLERIHGDAVGLQQSFIARDLGKLKNLIKRLQREGINPRDVFTLVLTKWPILSQRLYQRGSPGIKIPLSANYIRVDDLHDHWDLISEWILTDSLRAAERPASMKAEITHETLQEKYASYFVVGPALESDGDEEAFEQAMDQLEASR